MLCLSEPGGWLSGSDYRALGEAIVENKPMTRKNRARVAEYLREAGLEDPIAAAAA
jgi:hypothetical protein